MAALVASSSQPIELFGHRSSHMPALLPSTPHSPKPVPSASLHNDNSKVQSIVTPPSRTQENFQRAKTLEAFNSLLPPAVEFVEGSSTGTLALASFDGKYEPINASPKANGHNEPSKINTSISTTPVKKPSSDGQDLRTSLYTRPIETTWLPGFSHGSGLFNLGNTCFLNSALQCLLHTPPLIRILMEHNNCQSRGFCMTCAMRTVANDSFHRARALTPTSITKNLHSIAKHLRRGRQEDSHEFLRYAIDAMQRSCLVGHPPKLDPKIAETTWVHKVFGGRLRSRVTCMQCGHNSDTFDGILDLSIDIYNMNSLKEALKKFTAVDHLKGADKYKCEKCKKPVNAEKRFTVHEAPVVLTVHLKRFTPMGRKLSHPLRYDDRLDLKPVMSEGHFGPSYSLYGVICHAGSGPNSGHYFAHVKGGNGDWYEMNDEYVSKIPQPPTSIKNAYMLFYVREKGQGLEAAISSLGSGGQVNGHSKKRKHNDSEKGDEDTLNKPKSFIGPVIPDHLRVSTSISSQQNGINARPVNIDLQAEKLKRKIEAVERSKKDRVTPKPTPLKSLVPYGDDDEEEQGERVERPSESSAITRAQTNGIETDRMSDPGRSSPSRPPPTSELPTPSPSPISPKPTFETISTNSFYGPSSASSSKLKKRTESGKKRKSPDADSSVSESDSDSRRARAEAIEAQQRGTTSSSSYRSGGLSFGSSNPYSRSRTTDSLNSSRDLSTPRPPKKLQKKYGRKNRSLM